MLLHYWVNNSPVELFAFREVRLNSEIVSAPHEPLEHVQFEQVLEVSSFVVPLQTRDHLQVEFRLGRLISKKRIEYFEECDSQLCLHPYSAA